MHISKLSLVNYRNFPNAKLIFKPGINTVIGENGSGKTNLFRAIRLLLDDNMIRSANRLNDRDFHRGIGKWQGHWIIISLEFMNVSQDEAIQALFLHRGGVIQSERVNTATYNLIFRPRNDFRRRLAELTHGDHAGLAALQHEITVDHYETVFTGRSEADFNDAAFYKRVVGDFENVIFDKELDIPEIGCRLANTLSLAKEICCTYIQALRDVVTEFQNNRANPLLTLLRSKSGEIDPTLFEPIAKQVNDLNTNIANLPDVRKVRDDIATTIKDAAGETYAPSSLSIKSDLSDEADSLFQSLKLFIGEAEKGYEGTIQELSLGGANLIYLTLKLLEFNYLKSKRFLAANFLLIEEPEAHIHTHIQKTLFDRIKYPDTQVIYSTHSTHISEVCNVSNMNILGRNAGKCEAFQPSTALDDKEIRNIQRYLDAVRSNLLFAKSVILVEGDAEEILIPLMTSKVLGVSLDELGISLINIRSTGFKNVAILFHELRIKKRCSIITDMDASIVDTTPNAADEEDVAKFKVKCKRSQDAGVARHEDLQAFIKSNTWLSLHLARHTFEVDFVMAGNARPVADTVADVYEKAAVISQAKTELISGDVAVYGRRILTMAENQGKGWFAILLGNKLDCQVSIPPYIISAILFGAEFTNEMWANILLHRIECIGKDVTHNAEDVHELRVLVGKFKAGLSDLAAVKETMLEKFPTDALNGVLAKATDVFT